MIRYPVTQAQLETQIESVSKGWLKLARQRTAGFKKKKKYAEKSSIWSRVKIVYMKLQGNGKCAYCERQMASPVLGKIEQDVEHFRPKSSVRAWTLPSALKSSGIALTRPPAKAGYYALPYHPFNYCASCKPCNSVLKSDCFPIGGKYKFSGTDPAGLGGEAHYLIYPIGTVDADPETLISFNGTSPQPRSKKLALKHRALVTIEFFELNNPISRKELFIQRAQNIIALHPQLLALNASSPTLRVAAKKVVDSYLSAKTAHANCNRSFKRLFEENRSQARKIFLAATDLVYSSS